MHDNPVNRTFTARLKRLRLAAGHTQESLAAAAGVPFSTVGTIERGSARTVSTDHVARLAAVLGVSARHLLNAVPK